MSSSAPTDRWPSCLKPSLLCACQRQHAPQSATFCRLLVPSLCKATAHTALLVCVCVVAWVCIPASYTVGASIRYGLVVASHKLVAMVQLKKVALHPFGSVHTCAAAVLRGQIKTAAYG